MTKRVSTWLSDQLLKRLDTLVEKMSLHGLGSRSAVIRDCLDDYLPGYSTDWPHFLDDHMGRKRTLQLLLKAVQTPDVRQALRDVIQLHDKLEAVKVQPQVST